MKPSPWPPVVVLAVAAVLATVGVRAQRTLELRAPLSSAIPATMDGFQSSSVTLSPEESTTVGVTSYLSRVYHKADTTGPDPSWFQIYVGYYDRQTRGKTIHSPKNCLPGAGWEPLQSTTQRIATATGAVTVNRYLIQNEQSHRQALVFYWYQGRGRVAFNEYAVKWDLVRDAALRRRSEEALVRIVVPVTTGEDPALALASKLASRLVPSLGSVLPG